MKETWTFDCDRISLHRLFVMFHTIRKQSLVLHIGSLHKLPPHRFLPEEMMPLQSLTNVLDDLPSVAISSVHLFSPLDMSGILELLDQASLAGLREEMSDYENLESRHCYHEQAFAN